MSISQVLPGPSSLTQEYIPQNINCRNYLCSLTRNEFLRRIFVTTVFTGFGSYCGGVTSYKTYDKNFALGAGIGAVVGLIVTTTTIYLVDAFDRRINRWMRGELQNPIGPEENL